MENEEKNGLGALRTMSIPDASDAARAQALQAAMLAFDEARAAPSGDQIAKRQGNGFGVRLMIIFNMIKRNGTMKFQGIRDIRLPIGAAALGVLLFPLALQLNSSTNLTRPDPVTAEQAFLKNDLLSGTEVDASVEGSFRQNSSDKALPISPTSADGGTTAIAEEKLEMESSAPGVTQLTRHRSLEGMQKWNSENSSALGAPPVEPLALHDLADAEAGDRFAPFNESHITVTADVPVSTFSIDVDTASYAYVRRTLKNGRLPQPDAVRVEEMINYFDYAYAGPSSADVPFTQTISVYPTPWNADTKLMHIGIKGYVPDVEDTPANLVFLIDTSGSMSDADKLPLLKRSFALLIDQMDKSDTIAIVTYAGSAGTVLSPTPASEKHRILDALERLDAGGSTAGSAGIEQAYRLAETMKSEDSNARVILATDGDFNVGISDPEELKAFINRKREAGVSLSVLGFGVGNYNDALMQALAQNGNGNAFYIDSFSEARKVLVAQLQGNLTTIAQDVKIQVEFNPAIVSEYRLVGYETRALNREDFNNDKVDAGDIGAGHTVTAIYEITPVGSDAERISPLRYAGDQVETTQMSTNEYGFLKLRYKLPGETRSRLIEQAVLVKDTVGDNAQLPDDLRFGAAVAAFGQKLRGGDYADAMDYADIRILANGARGADAHGYRAEFLSLVELAASLDR